MTRILFLYNNSERIVTGGQKYEDMLMRTLQSQPDFEVERRWLGHGKGRLVKYFYGLKNLFLLRRLKKYDLVLLNSVEGLAFTPLARALKLAGRKVGVIHHHFIYEERSGLRHSYYKWLECGFLRSATHIVVPSPFILDQCREMFPDREIVYWQIPFASAVNERGVPEPGNLLYIGTVEPRKGLEFLVEAMADLKRRGVECRLKIIGKTVDEEYRCRLDERIAETGIDVEFMGYVSREVKDAVMREADVFAFPSRHEGYGMAICEAMVAGLPVVCFDNSAMPYTVKDGENGYLVADCDSRAFADALGRILSDRGLREKLSEGALHTAAGLMTPERFEAKVAEDVRKITSSNT